VAMGIIKEYFCQNEKTRNSCFIKQAFPECYFLFLVYIQFGVFFIPKKGLNWIDSLSTAILSAIHPKPGVYIPHLFV
jgi:hypothetical protein